MGLLGEVLLLPLAPVRGSAWVMRQVLAEAERRYDDPAAIVAELGRLEERLAAGELDEEEFDRLEDELLDRLERSRGVPSEPWGGEGGTQDGWTAPREAEGG
ncbi:gas vesicle protein [Streptomyces sulfonofaciens]|uniref:Gas vesicle protein n=1 Tax=Streptomyces sulfonofaciens TaxID=68272 RepID=A0A919GHH4_9ACTN|nr:gas vesicle protein GvpG [Streptomyces sulfonofaciens]GHH84060.1 gas vesicle protein [Streptomyces sulfonofaciens]